MAGRYSGLSLDLWDTVLFDSLENQRRRAEAQVAVLARQLTTREDTTVDPEQVEIARQAIWQRWDTAGVNRASVPVARFVEQVRDSLGARLNGSLDEVVSQYSAAGLSEFPPQVNPDARVVINQLKAQGIPSIVVSNTTRRGRSWLSFLEGVGSVTVTDVISSCDVGAAKPDVRIFQRACHVLGKLPSEVLHVGDVLSADVEGALSAGMGAALYTGLWSKYTEVDPGMRELPPANSGIPIIVSLIEVLSRMRVRE